MNFFTVDIKKMLVVAVIFSLPLISMQMEDVHGETSWYAKPFSFLTSVMQSTYAGFSQEVQGTTSLYLNLIDIKKENTSLKKEISQIRTQLAEMEELKIENQRFSELLNFKEKSPMKLVAAKVIGRDLTGDHATISLNKGTKDGISTDMAVITTQGVVGYIFRAEFFSSQVLLITDRYAVVDALVQRTRARGLVEGKSHHLCQLRYLERADDVAVGDLIVTSGLNEIFPKGFPLATVKNIENKNYGMSLHVTLVPAVDSNKIEEVFIVTQPEKAPLQNNG